MLRARAAADGAPGGARGGRQPDYQNRYAFVEFQTDAMAQQGLMMDGYALPSGNSLRVSLAKTADLSARISSRMRPSIF